MKKLIYSLIMSGISGIVLADGSESAPPVVNNNDKYINPTAYIQNPYGTLTSSGGTQVVSESQMANQNVAEKWFADGTWNVLAGAAAQYTGAGAGFPSYAYGANLFGQTGPVAGFSFGGLLTAVNPFFASNMNGYNQNLAPFLPANEQVAVSEAFVEYQYNNIVQVDAGLIGINNSPWLSQNYYSNILAPGATYQGILVNIDAGGGWLLTALGFNAAQAVSETGFTGLTFYNKGYDYGGGLIANNTTTGTSDQTIAIGANYLAWNNQYNLRLWGYEFQNYGSLLYADNSIKFQPNENLAFNVAAQGGTNNSNGSVGNPNGTNALTDAGLGQISSNFVGIQGGMTYKWFSLNVGYNSVWGPQSAYGNGGIVSPYTYGFATDPLYTTPYMAGLVDLGTAGSAYKISPSFNFLNGNLSIAPAFTSFTTASPQWNGTKEYDLVTTYSIPEIKGLTLFGVYAYQSVPYSTYNTAGSTYVTQIFVSYLY